jgi:hypothetical protein
MRNIVWPLLVAASFGAAIPQALSAQPQAKISGDAAPPGTTPVGADSVTARQVPVAFNSAEVTGVTVNAKEKCYGTNEGGRGLEPHVEDVYPKQGSIVAPGLIAIRVTFDSEMDCGNTIVNSSVTSYIHCGAHIWLIPGRKIFKDLCALESNSSYNLYLNGKGFQSYFHDIWGNKLKPYHNTFSTNNTAPVKTLHEAIMWDPSYISPLQSRQFHLPLRVDSVIGLRTESRPW